MHLIELHVRRFLPAAAVLLCVTFPMGRAGAAPAVTSSLSQAAAQTQPRTMVLAVKEQRTLPDAANIERIAIADPSVVDVVAVHGGALLVAKKSGTTALTLWHRGDSVPTRYVVFVQSELSASVLDKNGPEVTVHGKTAVISGDAPSLMAHEQALQVASDSAPTVIDTSNVAPGGVVQTDVKIVSFSKSVLKEAGFNLFTTRSNGFGFGVFSPSSLTSFTAGSGVNFGTVTSPIPAAFNLVAGPVGNGIFGNLSLLETSGLARILAEPTLVALSGQSASFLSGGELPIPEAGGLGTTSITFKPFGIGLTLTPTVLSANRIALKVAPEASELDFANAVTLNGTTVPSIDTRRADTTVELGDGESFIIGGLVSRSTASNVNKVPLLGDLPILGPFFRNLNYSQTEEELVIIVTPHIVRPIAKGAVLPLPGQTEEQREGPVWGDYVMGPVSGTDLPGFSR